MVAIAKEFHLGSDFDTIDHAGWQKQVELELKGAPFAKRMVSRIYEGIELQPLYTEETYPTAGDPAGMPGYQPFVRGARPLGNVLAGWDVRQEHAHPDPVAANAQILEDLNGGVTSIDLRLDAAAMQGLDADDRRASELTGRDGVSVSSVADVIRLAQGVRLDIAGFHFDAGAAFLPTAALYVAAAKQAGVPLGDLLGGFNADPLKALVRDGHLPVPLEVALRQMADLAAWTAKNAPRMTSVEVSTTPYHNAGATAVADIGFMVATGLDYLRALTDAGLDVDTAARQITFSMGLGCRFYLAIAKIRAARKLWADVIAASGGGAAAQKMTLRVSTGRRVMATRNQSLNILRNTVACYAGAIAGADIITTTPFDTPTGLPCEASRRNARNTQLILHEECHLARVVDPAGGSWYIEWYTNEIARRAWSCVPAGRSAGRDGQSRGQRLGRGADQADLNGTREGHRGTQGGRHRRQRTPDTDRTPHRAGATQLSPTLGGRRATPVQLAPSTCRLAGTRCSGLRPGGRRRAHDGGAVSGGGRGNARPDRAHH